MSTVLVVGATGTVGHLAVEESIRAGHGTRALVRSLDKARVLPEEAELFVGDVTCTETLAEAVDGVDGVVLTLGSHRGRAEAEAIDYGGVRNLLEALGSRPARIALMTSIGVTNRDSSYNRSTQVHDWKRRSERLVRASGRPYTIVRPGWFDYNEPGQHQLQLLQGDTRHAGDPSDGVIARQQIAEVLISSLDSEAASRKTFELVAATGPAPEDLDQMFAELETDPPDSLDGVRDAENMPAGAEPALVLEDLKTVRSQVHPERNPS